MLDMNLWCKHCNKIKFHRGKNGEQIQMIFVLPESRASVTELFTVADFRSLAIKFIIQPRSNAEFSASRTSFTY